MPHIVATLIYLSHNYSYYIRGDKSPLPCQVKALAYTSFIMFIICMDTHETLALCSGDVGPSSLSLTLTPLGAAIVVFNPFYYLIKSLLLGTK